MSDELLLYALVPLGIVILTFSCVGLRHRSLVPALPFVLRLTFFFYPAVSSKGFQTLAPCDCFRMVNDSKLCFLPADYSVECVEYDAFGFGHHAPPNLLVLGLSAAVLFGLSKEPELLRYFSGQERSVHSGSEPSFSEDMVQRVLPFVTPRFLRHSCQSPDAYVMACIVLSEMWCGEKLGNWPLAAPSDE